MGCLKLTHNQQPELRVVHAKKGVTSNDWAKSVCSSYPFGMALPGRSYNFSDQSHAFQGAFARRDHDTRWDEFLLRNYDARIGQFLSVDPFLQYASPYVAMGNNPLSVVDPTGGLGMDLGPEEASLEPTGYDYDYTWEIAFELAYEFGMNMHEAKLLAMSSGVRGLHIAREMAAFGYEWKEGSGWGFWKKANFKDAQQRVPFRGLDKMNVLSTVTVGEQWVEVYNPLPSNDKHGSGWLSYVPLIGSARDAWQDFQKGSYVRGTFNTALAVTDVFVMKAAAVAVGKIAFKTAGRSAAKASTSLATKYPTNAAISGTTERIFLKPGQVIDRYGSLSGKWFSQPGVSYGSRSIPLGQAPYTQFKVLRPFEVNRSLTSPGMFSGQKGFGIQFQSPVGADILIKRRIIAPF